MAKTKELTFWQKMFDSRTIREVIGVILLAITVFVLISLVSYNPQDASFGKYFSQRLPVQNYGGIIGSYLAGGLIILLGSGAYLIPLLILFLSICIFREKKLKEQTLIFSGGILFAIFFAAFLYLLFPGEDPVFGAKTHSGGALGYFISKSLITLFNPGGAFLIILTIILSSFLLITHLSLVSSLEVSKEALISYLRKIREFLKRERNKKRQENVLRPFNKEGKTKIASSLLNKLPLPEKRVYREEEFEKYLPKVDSEYQRPPLNFLENFSREQRKRKESRKDLEVNAAILEKKLLDFGIAGNVLNVLPGPVITTYEFEPASGVKVSRIMSLADDLAMAMRAVNIRILAPVPGKAVVGIEIPNLKREMVYLREIISSEKLNNERFKLPLGLGKSIMGEPLVTDLSQIPHLLIAGATGSGKSIGINCMICSLLFNLTPEQVKLIMIDPKMLELSIYDGIPHLITPVVTHPKKAAIVLKWVVEEMERRYKLLSERGVRNIIGYNNLILEEEKERKNKKNKQEPEKQGVIMEGEKLPYIVVVIDELADLMLVSSKEVEDSLTRLAQMARASGIHLLVATQRPSVDVLTGIIKANFPARISFQVSSRIDSRTILDTTGAEKLLGKGDMLFLPPGTSKLQRIHGSWVSESEIKRAVNFLKKQARPKEETLLVPNLEETLEQKKEDSVDYDEKYDQAVAMVARTRQASISMIQRRLRIGYNRAARIIEVMEKEGIIGPAEGVKPREVYIKDLDNIERIE